MNRGLFLAAWLAALVCVAACDAAVTSFDAGAGDASARFDAAADASLDASALMDVDLGTTSPLQCVRAEEDLPSMQCDALRSPPESFASVLDLREQSAIAGRCDDFDYGDPVTVLPSDLSAYPLLVRLSARGFDGECSACDTEDAHTAYGVAFELPDEIASVVGGPHLVVRTTGAWRFVSGGFGEAYPWPCMGGYQEFGRPLNCLASYASGFGIATSDPNAEDAEVLIDLLPNEYALPCCPYACE